ncbi:hypothetical protein EMPS_02985 [Entomortierella parvispora]|uniref:Mid2 domain-containing protein n=1 Tax=Entomortierella parvispora TaxID=205924 RepID=A0A9P3H5T9_9FUNG|nr:hypothetical protein EMPS_02985 [Entomortierella parvispora]
MPAFPASTPRVRFIPLLATVLLLTVALASPVRPIGPVHNAISRDIQQPRPETYENLQEPLLHDKRNYHPSLQLVKRAPPNPLSPGVVVAGLSDGPTPLLPPPSSTENPPPQSTAEPPATTDNPPPQTTVEPPSTTTTKPPALTTTEPTRPPVVTTTQPEPTETTTSSPEESPTPDPGRSTHTLSPRPPASNIPGSTVTDHPSGSISNPTSSPTHGTAPSSSGPPVLPIVLGTVLGLGALIGAGVFFFFRFRKHRRFDSKRPLSFLALSMDDSSMMTSNQESASARAGAGMDGDIYDVNRPITSQPSLRYTPPVMSGLFGGGNSDRYSYQSASEHSGATGAQFAQWSQDDENAALVGLRDQVDPDFADETPNSGMPRPVSDQSFVASSMVPMTALNSQRHLEHARYNRPTAIDQDEVLVPRQPQGIPSSDPLEPEENTLAVEMTLPATSGDPSRLAASPSIEHASPVVSRPGSLSRSRPVSVHSIRNQSSLRSNRSVAAAGARAPSPSDELQFL